MMNKGYARIDEDSDTLEDLLALEKPSTHDYVLLGAVVSRYEYPHPMAVLAQDIAEGWGLTIQQLQARCREIWSSGYRPSYVDTGVGSANDSQGASE